MCNKIAALRRRSICMREHAACVAKVLKAFVSPRLLSILLKSVATKLTIGLLFYKSIGKATIILSAIQVIAMTLVLQKNESGENHKTTVISKCSPESL
jgi:hypothetical protein